MKTKLAKAAAPIFARLQNEKSEGVLGVNLVEQTQLVRAALADAFPDVEFSVRCERYAGGCSIRYSWTDGPTGEEADKVADAYSAGGFDGSIDLAYYSDSWFAPDGTVSHAHTNGTAGSRGCVSESIGSAHNPNALLVSFAAKYITGSRSNSFEAQLDALAKLKTQYGPLMRWLEAGNNVKLVTRKGYAGTTFTALSSDPSIEGEWLQTLMNRVMNGNFLSEKSNAQH